MDDRTELQARLGSNGAPGIEDAYEALLDVKSEAIETNRLLGEISKTLTAMGVALLIFLASYFGLLAKAEQLVRSAFS